MKLTEQLWDVGGRLMPQLTLAIIFLVSPTAYGQVGQPCAVCKKPLGYTIYYTTDKVTNKEVDYCNVCSKLNHHCFACSLPVEPGGLVLEDGRHYCPRDGAAAVVTAEGMQSVVKETIYQLNLALRDYMTFPTQNLSVNMIDRINIDRLFAKIGHDYACPDLRAYYETTTNQADQRTHSIHILTGHTRGSTRSTLIHELTHAWIADNVPEERQLGRLAQEGFCELISYIVCEKLGDKSAMESIEKNKYTRGQFAAFKEAKRVYELRTIIDWVKYGTDPLIDASETHRVRQIKKPTKASPTLWVRYSDSATKKQSAEKNDESTAPTELVLKGILGDGNRRMAMISGTSLMIGEKGKARLGDKQVEFRCLEIGADFVRVEFVETGEEQKLHLHLD